MGRLLRLMRLAVGCLIRREGTADSLDTVREWVASGDAVMADVRERREWRKGHVAGAVLVPLSELSGDITEGALERRIPGGRIVYTYCGHGVRSRMAAEVLRRHGYEVRPLTADYQDLIDAGFQEAEE